MTRSVLGLELRFHPGVFLEPSAVARSGAGSSREPTAYSFSDLKPGKPDFRLGPNPLRFDGDRPQGPPYNPRRHDKMDEGRWKEGGGREERRGCFIWERPRAMI